MMEISNQNFLKCPKVAQLPNLKVSRSRNMKQKIYEILTSPKIQMNGIILNNLYRLGMFMV